MIDRFTYLLSVFSISLNVWDIVNKTFTFTISVLTICLLIIQIKNARDNRKKSKK